MFQVEPILWLQSLESPGITWVMKTTSLLGYAHVYALLLIVLIFGVRFKQSIFVFLTILICGILTDGLKDGLMFPRPSDVDARVIEPGYERPPLLIDGGGAESFWSLPSPEAMEVSRNQTDWSYGLPSGHVGLAAAFFLGLAFFYRSKGVFTFAVFWVLLMALSRMYLGRHFIADVLGGVIVGLFCVFLAAFLVRHLIAENPRNSEVSSLIRWAVFATILLVLTPFIDLLDKEDVGRIWGLLLTYVVLLKTGFPLDKGSFVKRLGRVLLAVAFFILIDQIINPIIDSMAMEDNSFGMLFTVFLTTCIPFVAIVFLARKLKLYAVK
ncbi:MAG: phosphatase PAP2 family protein [Bacteroidota bacterium]